MASDSTTTLNAIPDSDHSARSSIDCIPKENFSAPEAPQHVPTLSYLQRYERWKISHCLVGWRFSAKAGASITALVFATNLAAFLYATSTAEGNNSSRVVLLEGKCSMVDKVNTWIHIYINVASTILLGSSSFAMQYLSAPTREEVDEAHARELWLEIGVPSLRNLKFVRRINLVMWSFLAFTSLVLHLIFNSTVFATLNARSYTAHTIQGGILEAHNGTVYAKARYMIPDIQHPEFILPPNPERTSFGGVEYLKTTLTEDDMLTKKECIDAFGKLFVPDREMVIVDLSNETIWFKSFQMPEAFNTNLHINASYVLDINTTWAAQGCIADPTWWMCGSTPSCNVSCNYGQSSDWFPFGHSAERCFSPRLEERCKLEMSWAFAISVLVTSLLKTIVIWFGAFYHPHCPLLTLGDAISSFLEKPDGTTVDAAFLQSRDLHERPPSWTAKPRFWIPGPKRRTHALSRRKRTLYLCLHAAVMIVLSIALILCYNSVRGTKNVSTFVDPSLWGMNVKTLSTSSASDPGSLVNAGLRSNIVQTALSILYFAYNSSMTAFLQAVEWDQYGRTRKSLRVSGIPTGAQRSEYYLQLPLRYGVPLAAISSALHTFASQCFYMVSVQFVDQNSSAFLTGFSPPALLGLSLTLIIMASYAAGIAFRRLPNGMPIVGSCSAAISAACHPKPEDKGSAMAVTPLVWGVLSEQSDTMVRCGFSTHEVEFPQRSISFEVWTRTVKAHLDDLGLSQYLTNERPPLPPIMRFSDQTLFSRWLYQYYYHGLKYSADNLLDPEDFQARTEILSRIMYDAWDMPDLKLYHAKEIWEYLVHKYSEPSESADAGSSSSQAEAEPLSATNSSGPSHQGDLKYWILQVWNDELERASRGQR